MRALSTCRFLDVFHEIFRLTEIDPFLRSKLQAQLFLFCAGV
jgi:hypothetical protein